MENVIFVSGICEDEQTLLYQIDEGIAIECKSFNVVFENKISQFCTIDGGVKNSLLSSQPMRIKIKGTISLENNNALAGIRALAQKVVPFDLNIGGQNFSNVLLLKSTCKIDSFGVSAECELEFEEIFEGGR